MKRKADSNLATRDADPLVEPAVAGETDAAPTGDTLDPRRWLALTVLLVAACMDMLDLSIVNVGVPSIQSGLSAGYAAVEWVLAGYTLAFAVGLITGGRIGDLYGHKRMFLLGTAVFTVASGLCGVAVDPGMLIASRVLQGCGAALMVPQVLSIIQVSFPEKERAAALGAYGGAAGLATIGGPVLGGVLLHANLFSLTWRPIFLVNVVIGAIAMVAAALLVRESRAASTQRLDLGGVVLVSAGLTALIYPLVQGRDMHWPWWCFALLVLSVVLLAVFVRYEQRLTRAGGSPLVAMSLFSRRSFSFGTALTLSYMLGVSSFYLILSLYLQIGLGFTPLHSGLTTVPSSIGLAVAAVMAAKFVPKLGRRLLAPGALLSAASIAWMLLTFHQHGAAITSWQITPSMFVLGLGMGVVVPSLIDAALADVPPVHAGSASGVTNTMMQLGGAIGVAVIGVLFFGFLGAGATGHAQAVAPRMRTQLSAAAVPGSAQDQLVAGFTQCFHDRFATTDITATPASCRTPAGAEQPAVAQVLASAGRAANASNFESAIIDSLWFQVAAFALTGLLILGLPDRLPEEHHM